MGPKAIQQGEAINTETELQDRLIDLVSVGNLRHRPEALFALFRQFLKRISLLRLIHFLDSVLLQLISAILLSYVVGNTHYQAFFWLGAAWLKFRAERPSVSEVN